MTSWGKKLKEIRRFKGISQQDLAKRSQVCAGTISRIERGRHIPRIDIYDELLKSMGVKLEIGVADKDDWRMP